MSKLYQLSSGLYTVIWSPVLHKILATVHGSDNVHVHNAIAAKKEITGSAHIESSPDTNIQESLGT